MHWWIQGGRIPLYAQSLMLVVLTAFAAAEGGAVFRTQAWRRRCR